jgi:glycosyltransferase involved in cell wall biosynthesis
MGGGRRVSARTYRLRQAERVMSLRITLVAPVPPFRGGAAQHAGYLATALSNRADMEVLSWQHQYPKLLFRHEQHDSAARPHPGARFDLRWWDPISWWRAGRMAERGDLLVFAWVTPFHSLPYRVAAQAAGDTRKVAIVHNAVPHEKLPLQKPLTRWVLGCCDGLITHSTTVADELADLVPNVQTITIPMPPHIEVEVQPLPAFDGDDLRLLFFGFVRPYKGLDVALDALAILARRGMRPQLSVVGEFWEPVERWWARVTELGLAAQVALHPGYVPDVEVSSHLAAHHAVILPYRSASQSGIVPVALSAGRPVIATAVGGVAEAVTEGVNGSLAEPGDAVSLADAIERCALRLPALAARTRENVLDYEDVADVVLKVAGLDRS